jgi:hypothetical protein
MIAQDYNKWTDLVTAFIRHTIERYGIDEVRPRVRPSHANLGAAANSSLFRTGEDVAV